MQPVNTRFTAVSRRNKRSQSARARVIRGLAFRLRTSPCASRQPGPIASIDNGRSHPNDSPSGRGDSIADPRSTEHRRRDKSSAAQRFRRKLAPNRLQRHFSDKWGAEFTSLDEGIRHRGAREFTGVARLLRLCGTRAPSAARTGRASRPLVRRVEDRRVRNLETARCSHTRGRCSGLPAGPAGFRVLRTRPFASRPWRSSTALTSPKEHS